MTALDPGPIVEKLRTEREVFGQYRPETVDRLIAATERTGDLPMAVPLPAQPTPFPRGGRSTWPVDAPDGPTAPVIPLGGVCGARHPDRAVLCGLLPRHEPGDHVAYGEADRELARWEVAP